MLFLGGIIAMSLGALMLIDSPEEYLRIPISTIALVVGTTAGLFLFVVGTTVRNLRRTPVSGREGLLGAVGTVKARIDPVGTVFVQGTLWSARSSVPLETDRAVRVVGIEGLRLTVEPVTEER
jgi:membrane-bound serine protease (ClpP class)